MRILHVVPTYLPAVRYGGPIFAVHSLCRALAARGHDVEVFTTNVDGPGTSDVPLGQSVWLDGVRVRYFSSQFLRRLYWSPAMAHALKHEVANFDLLHLHSVFLWPIWAAARAGRQARVPYVMSPRGMLVKELVRQQSRWAKTMWISLIERSNLKSASAIHVTSELERAELMRFKWQLPRIVTISNGVEDPDVAVSEVSADIKGIAANQPLVLFLGRLSWKKGLDRLVRAFALTNVGTLAIVGTDDENMMPRLSPLVGSLKLKDRVRLLPRTVSGGDKEYLYAAAKLFVLPSYSENFGNTVLEAMRRALPVIVTPEVGAAEIVEKAGGGFAVPGQPEFSFAAAIDQLIADPSLTRSMGEAGQRYVLEHYTWPVIAEEMEGLYEGVRAAGTPISEAPHWIASTL